MVMLFFITLISRPSSFNTVLPHHAYYLRGNWPSRLLAARLFGHHAYYLRPSRLLPARKIS